jgi:hypothetical protein
MPDSESPAGPWRWLLVLLPALALAGWLALWLQWALPEEDDFGFGRMLIGLPLTGFLAAFVGARAGANRVRQALLVTVAAMGAAWTWLPITFAFLAVADGIRKQQVFWLMGSVAFFLIGTAALLFIGYVAGRVVTPRIGTPWRSPLAGALLIVLGSLTAFGAPLLESYKWCWPWTSFHRELQEFKSNAERAGERLGLPRDRDLTDEERARLAQETALDIELRFPIIGRSVRARIRDLRESEYVMISWGDGQFGPLHLRRKHILSASD